MLIIQETSLGIHYNVGADLVDYLKDPDGFGLRDGYVPLMTKPGLGIEIDEDKVSVRQLKSATPGRTPSGVIRMAR